MRAMTRFTRIPRGFDLVAAAAFGTSWVVAEAGRVPPLVDSPGEALRTWLVLAGYVVAIAVVRWSPAVAVSVITLVPILQASGVLAPLGPTQQPIYLASFWLAFAIARSGPSSVAVLTLVLSLIQATMIGVSAQSWVEAVDSEPAPVATDLTPSGPSVAILYLALFAAAWILGYVLRMNGERSAERRRLAGVEADLETVEAELEVVRERGAIAQEVHDVLAHSLAVVVAMADGARFIREKRPDTTDGSLRDIADAARSALVDLRGLMEELTDQTARPQPGLGDLDALFDRIRAAGSAVTVIEHGEVDGLTPAQELAVFRILQEALTNVLKHGGRGGEATVSLDWRGAGLAATVHSRGAESPDGASSADPSPGRGFGLRGMAERARLAGGWLTAEPTEEDDGGFLVTAFIPTAVRDERVVA